MKLQTTGEGTGFGVKVKAAVTRDSCGKDGDGWGEKAMVTVRQCWKRGEGCGVKVTVVANSEGCCGKNESWGGKAKEVLRRQMVW